MRRYADEVVVRRGDDAPEQFLWRDRLYVVRSVLGHWFEAGRWWRTEAARALVAGEPAGAVAAGGAGALGADDLVLAPVPASPKWAQRAWGEPAPDLGAHVGPAGIDDAERETWRVEASAGQAAGTGVYDLCFDWSAGAWTLSRVLD